MQLARRGELITHHKDKAVLRFLNLDSVIEKDLKTIPVDASLGDLVKVISKSTRNIFPVLDDNNELQGIVQLDHVREIMFNHDLYDSTYVRNLMITPLTFIRPGDSMEEVMKKFQDTNAWNLPVIDDKKFLGLVSKSSVFSEYRKQLLSITEE